MRIWLALLHRRFTHAISFTNPFTRSHTLKHFYIEHKKKTSTKIANTQKSLIWHLLNTHTHTLNMKLFFLLCDTDYTITHNLNVRKKTGSYWFVEWWMEWNWKCTVYNMNCWLITSVHWIYARTDVQSIALHLPLWLFSTKHTINSRFGQQLFATFFATCCFFPFLCYRDEENSRLIREKLESFFFLYK